MSTATLQATTTPSATPSTAIFRSVDHAIKFAYAIREYPIIRLTAMEQWLARGDRATPAGEAMTQHDWHAQSALILGHIAKLPDPLRAYVLACYSWGPERAIAIATLDQHAVRQLDGPHPDLLRDLVRRYLDQGRAGQVSQGKLAQKHAIDRNGVRWWENKVKDFMQQLDHELERCLGERWRQTGLIE